MKNRTNAGETPLGLSGTEMRLLVYLHSHSGRPVSRDELLTNVWHLNPKLVSTRTVDVHVSKLRAKIEPNRQRPSRLVTVFGSGYMLKSEVVEGAP